MIKGTKIRKFGNSYVLEITQFSIEPFRSIKEALENIQKLPAYILLDGDTVEVRLPSFEGEKVVIEPVGTMTSIWRSGKRYFITIPSELGSEGTYTMKVEGSKVTLREGIVFKRSEFFRPASELV